MKKYECLILDGVVLTSETWISTINDHCGQVQGGR